ncbi:MAG: hypothetical protein IPJ40_11035 [Saprospirales bacterium]|nr:hypothetical protein [Saprospirales bacterium]
MFEGASVFVGGTEVWIQKDAANEWQASTFVPIGGNDATPEWVDWGDNLESKSWTNKSIVRTEVSFRATDVLTPVSEQPIYQHIPGGNPARFEMVHVSGQGIDEVWGTTSNPILADTAMVYTNKAYVVIQRLASDFGDVEQFEADVETHPYGYYWNFGNAANPMDDRWMLAENPKVQTAYSAEINVQGKVVFGYNWNMKKATYSPGIYRITFYTLPTSKFSLRHAAHLQSGENDSGNEGGRVTVDGQLNITYIDVKITDKAAGGGGSGNGNGGSGGGNGGSGGGSGQGGGH